MINFGVRQSFDRIEQVEERCICPQNILGISLIDFLMDKRKVLRYNENVSGMNKKGTLSVFSFRKNTEASPSFKTIERIKYG